MDETIFDTTDSLITPENYVELIPWRVVPDPASEAKIPVYPENDVIGMILNEASSLVALIGSLLAHSINGNNAQPENNIHFNTIMTWLKSLSEENDLANEIEKMTSNSKVEMPENVARIESLIQSILVIRGVRLGVSILTLQTISYLRQTDTSTIKGAIDRYEDVFVELTRLAIGLLSLYEFTKAEMVNRKEEDSIDVMNFIHISLKQYNMRIHSVTEQMKTLLILEQHGGSSHAVH